uniref:Uncharacterized protein n=1 Tax=Setaria italica TaxID=4555 RepID=K3ZGE5_SETIT
MEDLMAVVAMEKSSLSGKHQRGRTPTVEGRTCNPPTWQNC